MNQKTIWNIGAGVGVLIIIFLAVLSIKEIKSIAYVGKNEQIINTITVSGKAETFKKPDIATFSFSVTETAKVIADAQDASANKVDAALKALNTAGVDEKDIKTISYNINPHYEYQEGICTASYPSTCRPGKSVLTGYDVSQSIQVKVRDLSKAGSILGSIGALDIQDVNGLTFSVDAIDAVKDQVRAQAIADAQTKARVLAQQLGVTLVRVNGFYDSNDQGSPMPYNMGGVETMSAKVASVAVPSLPAGEDKITSNVTITYEIR